MGWWYTRLYRRPPGEKHGCNLDWLELRVMDAAEMLASQHQCFHTLPEGSNVATYMDIRVLHVRICMGYRHSV